MTDNERRYREALENVIGAKKFILANPPNPSDAEYLENIKVLADMFTICEKAIAAATDEPTERDFTPEEALEEARRRWGIQGWIVVTDEEVGWGKRRLFYKVGKDMSTVCGHSFESFRAAYAAADRAKEGK